MPPICQVGNCNVKLKRGVKGHRFPKRDKERAKRWLIACKIEFGDIRTVKFDNRYICSKHFAEDAYEEEKVLTLINKENPEHTFKQTVVRTLKSNAMPTLFMPRSAAGSLVVTSVRRQSTENRMAKKREKEERMERKRVSLKTFDFF